MTELDKVRIAELEKEVKILKAQLEEPKSKKKVDKLTEMEIYQLTKKEQAELIKELGGESVPKYEKDRVKMILELQD